MKKKRKLNKKAIIIVSIILIILLIEIINPIKLYNKHQLRGLNYSDSSIDTILENNLKDEVLGIEYNKTLDTIFSSSDFNKNNYSIYKDLEYYDLENYTKNINELIKKGYVATDINYILRSATNESLKEFLDHEYVSDISSFLQYDFAILENYDRYVAYKEENNIENELVVVYVNIGLDRDFYTDPETVTTFSTDMLVNKYNGLEEDFVPDDLISVPEDYAIDSEQQLNETVFEAFKKMSDDCKSNTSYKLLVRSGYRSYESQQETYDLYFDAYGKNYAESYVAHPGFSEHQTGLAIDIKAESSNVFAGTEESIWLMENAYRYGFILRYKKEYENITGISYESWHYRYVGEEIAKEIYENDMTYEEYYIRFLNK